MYSYDYENRLTSAVEKCSGGSTLEQVTYTYDALGRQIGVDTNGTQRWTVFTGSSADANPYADYTGAGALSMRYLYGLAVDQILARTDPSAYTAWYLTDQLGSVWNVVSWSGTVLDAITYDAYGNILNETSPSNGDRFKFAGMQYDEATGLYYDHARYYDPNTGRFVSQDPKGFAAGDTNLYRYVGNSPTIRIDPSGLKWVWPWDPRANWSDWRIGQAIGTFSPLNGTISSGLTGEVYLGFSHIQVGFEFAAGLSAQEGLSAGAVVTGGMQAGLGLGLGGGATVTLTNASSVSDLGGSSGYAGLSTPFGGGDIIVGSNYGGGTISLGPQMPVAGIHLGDLYSYVVRVFSCEIAIFAGFPL